MFGRKAAIGALLILAAASAALACGPFFPWQLLDNRPVTLKSTPHNSFAWEASHLVTPRDHLGAVEPALEEDDTHKAADFRAAEDAGLTRAQIAGVDAMRAAATGDDAWRAGAAVPEAVRLYTAGAVAFRHGDDAGAAARFAAVLALAPDTRKQRATWAAFMAGRVAAQQNDATKAAAMFALTRSFAVAGAPDPLGLAVASYGEEARPAFDIINPETVGATAVPVNASAYHMVLSKAAALYAEQAARGSDSGVQSLRMIAENAFAASARMAAAVADPLLERLLVDYALARVYDESANDEGTPDAGTHLTGVKPNPQVLQLVDAILHGGASSPAGADRLAALCYRMGRYDCAARMAARSDSALAEWVKAKLALQKGDMAIAAQHYAAASGAFPNATLEPDNRTLVVGEGGVLALARGDYVDALATLWPVARTYWGDVAFIAERVLTVGELQSFVDAHAPAPAQKSAPAYAWYDSSTQDPPRQLRALLARRLMREGRYAAALSYFDDPKLQAEARAYARDLHEGATDWGRVDRAEALFEAATLAREQGMDILGTEIAPDMAVLQGEYDSGMGQDKPAGPYVTKDEGLRAAASLVRPDIRYHYRYVAVGEANAAADLLPHRSQAFAAVLCAADGWMKQTPGEDARVRAIWRRYVAQGPRVPFARRFGHNCPAPDFTRAIALERHQLYLHTRHYLSRHRWWFVGAAVLLLGALAAAFVTLRRRPVED
jgi:hypothetical protein